MYKREPSYTAGTATRKTIGRLLKKLKIELPHDPAIPLRHIFRHPMFTAALFTVDKTRKQPFDIDR